MMRYSKLFKLSGSGDAKTSGMSDWTWAQALAPSHLFRLLHLCPLRLTPFLNVMSFPALTPLKTEVVRTLNQFILGSEIINRWLVEGGGGGVVWVVCVMIQLIHQM